MIKKYLNFKAWGLMQYEIASLVLMLIFLPSFEAPKNLFLVSYVLLSLTRQYNTSNSLKFEKIDYVFLFLLATAFLSTVFSGLHGHEWKGFKSFSTVFIFGWAFVRSEYTKETIRGIFLCAILTILPPLFFGLYELLWAKHSTFLKIHSVGYVNASGLYLMAAASAAMSYVLFYNPKKHQIYHYLFGGLLTALFGFSLLIASSRSAFLAFVIAAVILILFSKIKFKKSLLSLFLVSFSISFLLNAPVFEKHMEDVKRNDTLASRDKLWNVSFEAVRSFSNKFGTGIDNYGFADEVFVKRSVESRGETYDPKNYFYVNLTHNVYLSYLVERGFLGLISLIALMIFWANGLLANIKRLGRDSHHDYLWGGSLSAFLSVYLVGFVHVTLVHEPGILALFFFGLYRMYTKLYANKKA
ncbi:O-antigen ligase family protein [Candidatus Methylopumilus planktonicus]|uniref:O-antigen ligase family protein n=1 Tax=Candidatus Methylopumilus planktonicus TaxID=1581557 RepID=UPI003BEEDDC9